jgi:LemA protein
MLFDVWPGLGTWLARLALVGILLGWVMGAYNRLVRLRQALGQAWGQIDEVLTRRAAALEPLVEALREPLAAEATTLLALTTALERQQQAAQQVRLKPSSAVALQAWVVAEVELASPLARLQALVEQHSELAHSDAVRPFSKQLAELAPRLGYARQGFNDTVQAYNAAVEEFPTRLLTGLFGFAPAARI